MPEKINYDYRKDQCVAKQDNTRVKEKPRYRIPVQHKKGDYLKNAHYNIYSEQKAQARIQNAIACAEAEYKKGVKETSKNDSKDIRKYKFGEKNDWDWCAYFANYCYGIGQNDKRTLFGIDNGKVGRSQLIKEKALEFGYFEKANSGYTPKEGDLAIWTSKSNSCQGHIGIVSKVYEDGSYDVIEGNRYEKISKIHYNSQKHKDADLKTKYFAGFVRMEDYLYDLETCQVQSVVSTKNNSKDLYLRDDKSTMDVMF